MLKIPSRSFFFNHSPRYFNWFLNVCACAQTCTRVQKQKGNVQKNKHSKGLRLPVPTTPTPTEWEWDRNKKWTKAKRDRKLFFLFFSIARSSNVLDILLILNYSLLNLFCACFFFSFVAFVSISFAYTFIIFIFPAFGLILFFFFSMFGNERACVVLCSVRDFFFGISFFFCILRQIAHYNRPIPRC